MLLKPKDIQMMIIDARDARPIKLYALVDKRYVIASNSKSFR
jgi:hypothetical protein